MGTPTKISVMIDNKISWKRVLVALFLFFSLSSFSFFSSSPQWQLDEIKSRHSSFSSKRIIYPTLNRFNGLELEFTRAMSNEKMYINVFSIEIPESQVGSSKAKVTLEINNLSETIDADLLRGGQRLLLPHQTTQQMISALLRGEDITIKVGRYSATIPSANFKNLY